MDYFGNKRPEKGFLFHKIQTAELFEIDVGLLLQIELPGVVLEAERAGSLVHGDLQLVEQIATEQVGAQEAAWVVEELHVTNVGSPVRPMIFGAFFFVQLDHVRHADR